MKQADVPPIWQHLPFHRGYPVPYFVQWLPDASGESMPNFHRADGRKWVTCLKFKKCWVCSKSLDKASFMVTGPKGLTNRVGTDCFMHEACARESIRLCPHMLYQKTARRDVDSDSLILSPHHDLTKPLEIALVKTGAWQIVHTGLTYVINYQPLAVQWFHYIDGLLVAKTETLAPVDSNGWKRAGFKVVPINKL
ncbi:hypothetical protein GO755_26580 [Spirosoma sp. HMF4905]|uniref:Uncharacterized protein n=1 Tax=Spirosoma arboris TaxID=2682092 RepID=A0A7K1SIN0_9BACT|nr:hypothetical protein [Spirosoma arboris]MVM33633.1 hypothetical protein [Spirosoma arboris]